MHRPGIAWDRSAERIAWILDDVWPETGSMVEALFKPNDQLLAPGIFPGFPERYRWPVRVSGLAAAAQTAARHWSMRRVARAPGGIRQRSYLVHDRAIAVKLAKAIDYRCRHLVVAQSWLPWLDDIGALGGRTFDVVMSRYPLAEVHRLLDDAAAGLGRSATIADFRAEPALVERETDLLGQARRVITPHHGIAALFPDQAHLLVWHRPAQRDAMKGTRVAFVGPTIARQRPDLVRDFAAALDEPLVVFGPIIESLWNGVVIEPRTMGSGWLDEIGAILHPATMTHQARELLDAVANGVPVYATPACGLAPSDYRPFENFRADWLRPPLVTSAAAG